MFEGMTSDSYRPPPAPYKWAKIEDYCPDRSRSSSALYIEPQTLGVRWFLQVKGLGVLTIYAELSYDDAKGSKVPVNLVGSGALTKDQIGPCERL